MLLALNGGWDQLTDEEQDLQKVTGLETWFKLPRNEDSNHELPPRWMMWLVTVAVIYPKILALFNLLSPPWRDGRFHYEPSSSPLS